MITFLVEHAIWCAAAWALAAFVGLLIHLINERQVKTGDVVLAIVFGIFYLIAQAWSWETVLIRIPEPREKR